VNAVWAPIWCFLLGLVCMPCACASRYERVGEIAVKFLCAFVLPWFAFFFMLYWRTSDSSHSLPVSRRLDFCWLRSKLSLSLLRRCGRS
jgi:hypothetical protein